MLEVADDARLHHASATRGPGTGWSCGMSWLIVIAAFLAAQSVLLVAATISGTDAAAPSSYARWDSTHYLDIAANGYDLHHCDPSTYVESPYTRHDWCGNAGWFPGYAVAIRAATGVLPLAPSTAGAFLARVAHLGMLALLWFAFLRRRPRGPALIALAIAAVFPGFVYLDGIFPVSIALVSIVGSLALLAQRRWLLAGVAGAVAVACYPSGITLTVVGLVVAFLLPGVGDVRYRLACALRYGAPLIVTYVGVLAMWEATVGRWDAWMLTQRHYGYAPAFFLDAWWTHVRAGWPMSLGATGPALQTLLVAMLLFGGLAVAFAHRAQLDAQELVVIAFTAVFWLLPLSMGGALSLYRAESLLVPAAVLTVRCTRRSQVALLAACLAVGVVMSVGFFDATLV